MNLQGGSRISMALKVFGFMPKDGWQSLMDDTFIFHLKECEWQFNIVNQI